MAFSAAVRKHPKPLVLSYSPGGGNTVEAGRWVAGQATAPTPGGEGVTGPSTQPLGTMYRIVTDFHGGWYGWGGLQQSLMIQGNFSAAGLPGANNTWPDPDMIPIGSGWWGKSQEQDDRGQTIMTAFILSRAPLMVAGKMPLDDKSLQYLTNPLALKIHADTKEPHGVEYQGNCTSPGNTIPRDYFPAHPCVQIWAKANLANSSEPMEIGLINLGENSTSISPSEAVSALAAAVTARGPGVTWTGVDVWTGVSVSVTDAITLRPHASRLLQFTPKHPGPATKLATDDGMAAASATIEASYPFLNGERHLFHARSDGRNALLASKGGGFAVLDADSERLAPLAGVRGSVPLETKRTGGQVHGFAPRTAHASTEAVFVAAGHAGVFRVDAATYNVTAQQDSGDAWAVALCGETVVVGTHGTVAGGGPQLIAYDAASLEQLWKKPAPGDVWAVSCAPSGDANTLIVGGWCFGLQAWTISRSGASVTARWSPDAPLFVRDAILAPSGKTVVVSANLAGVIGLSLSEGRFEHMWTIDRGGTATGLSLPPNGADGGSDAVVAAFAPAYGPQFQFFGTCGAPVPCDQPTGGSNRTALASSTALLIGNAFSSQPHQELSMDADSGLCLFSGEERHTGALREAGIFARNGEMMLVAMCPQLMVLPFRDTTLLSERKSAGVFGNAFDSVAIPHGDVLYTSSEQGLASFSMPDLRLLQAPVLAGEGDANAQGCIAMSATQDRIFCSAHSAGISVYSLAQPEAPAFLGHISSDSPTQRPYSSPIPMPALDDPKHLWLYATMGRATLSVFNATADSPAEAVQLATLQLPVAFVFGVAVATADERHYVYVSFSNSTHRRGGASTTPTQVGILTFEATLSGTGVDLRALGATVGLEDQPSTVLAGGVTLDPELQRLYVAYSCSSVIAYDVSAPAAPKVWAVRNLQGMMVFQVSIGPGHYVYVGLPASEDHDRTPNATATGGATPLGTGMALVDASTPAAFATGFVSVMPVAWSAIAQATLPSDRSRLIVADGASGLFSLSVTV